MQQAYYSIQDLYLFPNFRAREDYRRATGKEASAYDPGRPPKYWFDPAAANAAQRVFVYENAFYPAGAPMLDAVILKREEAATVNIYEAGLDSLEPREPEVPTPLRALKESEEILRGPLGNPVVHDRSALPANEGFTENDRNLLKAIALKLEIAA